MKSLKTDLTHQAEGVSDTATIGTAPPPGFYPHHSQALTTPPCSQPHSWTLPPTLQDFLQAEPVSDLPTRGTVPLARFCPPENLHQTNAIQACPWP